MFFNNSPKRPMPRPPMRPAPQPVRSPFMGAFGNNIVPAPQPAPQPASQPVRSPFMSAFGNNIVPAPQPAQGPSAFSGMFGNSGFGQPISPIPQGSPVTPPPMQGPSAFSGMFGNSGFGQPLPPFTSAFGQPFARAPQQPQPAAGLAGLGTMSPEQITQLQNSMGPQTLPANINQQLGMMRPGYANTGTQNMMGGPGMGFPAVPVQNLSLIHI